MINIIIRTIITLIVLFIIVKLIGKKQVSQLNIFDYIIGITIGSIVADISLDVEKNLFKGIIVLFIYAVSSIIISYLTMKNISIRRFISGVPTILIEDSKIIESGLKKSKIDLNDLLTEARCNGYFNLDEISYAIMEISGKISFLPKEENKPLTKKDMKIKTLKNELVANIILDEKILEDNLTSMKKNKSWLEKKLHELGYESSQGILLATLDNNNQLIIYPKNISSNKKTILE